ncbi:MAG: TIR domain-containing protein [Chloroflexota bacterium]|nr:TIR domain-containing protein [Chloroflexota bacterium]
MPTNLRYRCYLSFDHQDESPARAFIEEFDPRQEYLFTRKETVPNYILSSTDPAFVAQRMRQYFLLESTVTIVLVGKATWTQRSVEAELLGSLYRANGLQPSGLVAIRLLHRSITLKLPERLRLNLDSGYARFHLYPDNPLELSAWIEDAHKRRTARLHVLKDAS